MKSPFLQRYLSVYFPIVISIFIGGGLSLMISLIHWSAEVYKVQTNFEKEGYHLVEHLEGHIQEYINITQALGAFYDSSDEVTRQDFKLFTQHFLDKNLGILGMAWAPRISEKERLGYEKEMRNSGFSEFKIWSKNKIPLNNKNEYFPVTYGEPQQIYPSVIGLELSSNPVLNSPLEKARDTGEIIVSQPINLINGGQGFMLYYPVYRRESYPNKVQERRQEFRGVVYTVYRLEDLIKMMLNHLSSSDQSFFISNTPTLKENTVIISFNTNTRKINTSTTIPFSIPSICQTSLACQKSLTIADSQWFLTIIPEVNQKNIFIKSALVLWLGLGITTLITVYLWKTLSDKKHIEKVITERTSASIKSTESLEKLIEKRTHQLEKANEEKTQILDKINHTLRLPLNNILGFLNLLSCDNNLTVEQKNNLHIIQENSQYLSKLLNQILDFSNFTSAAVSSQLTIIDLENLVISIFNQFEENVQEKQLKLNYYIDGEVPPHIKIDENQLRKILVNLIENSIKFTNNGMIVVRLFCDNQAWLTHNNIDDNINPIDNINMDQKNLWIEVEDSGNGIPLEIQSKVFEPFFSFNDKKGVGLGLSITSQLVNLMGGNIYLKSQLGRGTIVQMFLPITIPQVENISKNSQEKTIVSIANYEPDYRILIIDNQDKSRQLLTDFLEPIGFDVKEISDLENARDISQNWHPHLIFIDTKMILLDEKKIIKEIKNVQSVHQITIIGIASGKLEDSQINELKSWCDDFLCKPVAIELILEKVTSYLEVQYFYEYQDTEIVSTEKMVRNLNSSALKMMSSQWLQQVYWAASSGNRRILEQLIQQIPENHYSVTNSMMQLVNTFDYRKIRQIIEPFID